MLLCETYILNMCLKIKINLRGISYFEYINDIIKSNIREVVQRILYDSSQPNLNTKSR